LFLVSLDVTLEMADPQPLNGAEKSHQMLTGKALCAHGNNIT
jgi:hypothetical protein